MMNSVVQKLLDSGEATVRYKVLVNVLGRNPNSAEIQQLQQEIRASPRVQKLLSGWQWRHDMAPGPYRKWIGAHWVLADLADIGYPSGDESLIPIREHILDWLFSEKHQRSIKRINGRVRRCASQEGNALYYLTALGLGDDRTDQLAARLIEWQWPDGGWNCDVNPEAHHSSFMETLIPLRGLAIHARKTGNQQSRKATARAAEVFLKRRLFKRHSDGAVIDPDFIQLHYPCYWHYDILFGLKVLAEAGFIQDERCQDALALLASKQLKDGGFPAEKAYYRVSDKPVSGGTMASWGETSKRRLNPFVTADALYVLKTSGFLAL